MILNDFVWVSSSQHKKLKSGIFSNVYITAGTANRNIRTAWQMAEYGVLSGSHWVNIQGHKDQEISAFGHFSCRYRKVFAYFHWHSVNKNIRISCFIMPHTLSIVNSWSAKLINSPICRRIVWVCFAIFLDWRLKS